jgi:hypothetical protein
MLVAGALPARVASAQANPNTAAADAAFKEGRELFKAGKYGEACEQFEKSQKLDPANGTLFNIAQCSEKIGKLATAVADYRDLVAKDTNAERKATASERLKVLAPRVPKLYVKLASPPPGVVVEIDSKDGPRTVEANKAIEMDSGDYTVVVRAKGYSELISRVKIGQEGKTTTIDATLKAGATNSETIGVAKPDEKPRADRPAAPASRKKLYGMVAMGGGGAALVTGIVFGSLARSKWNDAKAVCGGTTCTTQEDVDRANALGDSARSKALVSTILVIGGAAIAGAGIFLYVTAPGGTQITPTASDTGAGVSLTGQF